MKKILLFVAAAGCVFMLNSCKSKSSAYRAAYEQAKSSNDNAWMYDEVDQDQNQDQDLDQEEVLTSKEISYEAVRQERLSPVHGENESSLKKYSVVIGSFKNSTNAYSLKERMVDEGFRPIIVKNDLGMLRVIVASFDSRADAVRSRDSIKSKYAPNFHDAWLLERRY
jgi:hypothetical protein